jgi:Right handed beta helix region
VATNHAKVGLWVGDGSRDLYAVGMRIRNTMADGVNINGNNRNVRVEQSTTRNTGDDAMAMWSWSRNGYTVSDSSFAFNTLSLPILANGAAIYGGSNNRIEDNLITDTVFQGSGVTVSSRHEASPFTGTTAVRRNTLTRTGAHSLDWNSDIGAIWVYAEANDITGAVVLRDLEVVDSSYQGLLSSWQKRVHDLTVERVVFNGTGTTGLTGGGHVQPRHGDRQPGRGTGEQRRLHADARTGQRRVLRSRSTACSPRGRRPVGRRQHDLNRSHRNTPACSTGCPPGAWWTSARCSVRIPSRREPLSQAKSRSTGHRILPRPEPWSTPRRAMTGVMPRARTKRRYLSWS